MTEVLQSSPSHHFPSPSSSTSTPCVVSTNDVDIPHQHQQQDRPHNRPHEILDQEEESKEREREGDQVSIVELLVAAFRRSIVGCSVTASTGSKDLCRMEIGVPTNVSATVFGVSTESMQLSYDSRGNSVPTILLMMQRQLYAQGGLQAEGIFRITAGNSQEEYVRDQLNKGVIPEGVDVHCLAGLIKAWFRELPTGVLDSLSPEQVMQCQSEEECAQLARLLPPTEAALLDWAINLMADVAQMEHLNKMNARNVAMVFAPNMTQMSDPLTALMYAVQVMDFLKNLIIRTLREREESVRESAPASRLEPTDENGHQNASQPSCEEDEDATEENEWEKSFVAGEPALESPSQPIQDDSNSVDGSASFLSSIENISVGKRSLVDNCPCEVVSQVNAFKNEHHEGRLAYKTRGVQAKSCKSQTGQSSASYFKRGKVKEQPIIRAAGPIEKGKGTGIVGRINPKTELFEAWR